MCLLKFRFQVGFRIVEVEGVFEPVNGVTDSTISQIQDAQPYGGRYPNSVEGALTIRFVHLTFQLCGHDWMGRLRLQSGA